MSFDEIRGTAYDIKGRKEPEWKEKWLEQSERIEKVKDLLRQQSENLEKQKEDEVKKV